jgi:hypothetical protein
VNLVIFCDFVVNVVTAVNPRWDEMKTEREKKSKRNEKEEVRTRPISVGSCARLALML